ncbi:MAG: hypothetical protein M3R20_02735 [Pseudomonadota bacterium]|nr:hypothetical protein [Pseudomonadota bacterium]
MSEMTQRALKLATHAVDLSGIVGTLWIFFRVNGNKQELMSNGGILFLIWIALPYLVISAITCAVKTMVYTVAFVLTAVLLAPSSIFAYADSLLIHPDAQSGLIFVVLPPCLLAVILFAFVAAVIVKIVRKI